MEAERRGGGQIDVRRVAVVEGDAEHLPDLARRDRKPLRLVDPMLSARRFAGRSNIDDAADRPIEIDREDILVRGILRNAGKTGYVSLARLQHLLCGNRLRQQEPDREKR
jgi:hypothetical protein